MSSNHILINNGIEFEVPDSEMETLMEWLYKHSSGASNSGIKKEPEDEEIILDD